MNERRQSWLPSITLLLLALTAGLAWRIELELRSGWASLAWLGYFHWAAPIFVAAFIAWVAVFAAVRRRAAFVSAVVGLAVVAYDIAEIALRFFFDAGPSAAFTAVSLGHGDLGVGIGRFEVLRWLSLAAWSLIPLSFCLLCRLFGAPVTLPRALCSAALFVVSWPVAVFVRGFFEQHGSPDGIHALKSGFVVPFLVVSLGIPLLHFPPVTSHASPRAKAP
jgi:hypothetical protein